MNVAIIGGTGAEGFGLALRLARAGHAVTIGSRSAERGAASAAKAIELLGPDASVTGDENAAAAEGRHVVVVTVPFEGMVAIYKAIAPVLGAEQIVLDATSPLMAAIGGRPWQAIRPWQGSAAELAATFVPDGVRIVAGFHTVAAHLLQAVDEPLETDVLLCGDDRAAVATVGELVGGIPGVRWVDAGPLANARITETLTPLLISINRRYKTESSFRIVGREAWGLPI